MKESFSDKGQAYKDSAGAALALTVSELADVLHTFAEDRPLMGLSNDHVRDLVCNGSHFINSVRPDCAEMIPRAENDPGTQASET